MAVAWMQLTKAPGKCCHSNNRRSVELAIEPSTFARNSDHRVFARSTPFFGHPQSNTLLANRLRCGLFWPKNGRLVGFIKVTKSSGTYLGNNGRLIDNHLQDKKSRKEWRILIKLSIPDVLIPVSIDHRQTAIFLNFLFCKTTKRFREFCNVVMI